MLGNEARSTLADRLDTTGSRLRASHAGSWPPRALEPRKGPCTCILGPESYYMATPLEAQVNYMTKVHGLLGSAFAMASAPGQSIRSEPSKCPTVVVCFVCGESLHNFSSVLPNSGLFYIQLPGDSPKSLERATRRTEFAILEAGGLPGFLPTALVALPTCATFLGF